MNLTYCTAHNERLQRIGGDDIIQRLSAIQSALAPGDRVIIMGVSDISVFEVENIINFLLTLPYDTLKGL